MEMHQHRVINEQTELQQRIHALDGFVHGRQFVGVPLLEQMRLRRQLDVMIEYNTILAERIAAF